MEGNVCAKKTHFLLLHIEADKKIPSLSNSVYKSQQSKAGTGIM